MNRNRERRLLLSSLEACVGYLSKSKARTAKALVAGLDPAVLELVTRHGKLVALHRKSAPPATLPLDDWLRCVEALELKPSDIAGGLRPCIADARYCYVRPSGSLHMGPPVPR